MTVKVRARNGHVQYDIRFTWPDGTAFRERKNAPVSGRAAALRWAQERERTLLAAGKPAPASTMPTLAAFWLTVVRDHYKANRRKASTIDSAETAYRLHLGPALGALPLDQITDEAIAILKGRLVGLTPKTVNNVLCVLSKALRCAVAWKVLPSVPCRFDLLKDPTPDAAWYEVHDYRRLVDGARKAGTDSLVLVLLGGSAGLRRGEIRALKWTDLDMPRRTITVRRAFWHGQEGTPKGGRSRQVQMTGELHDALVAHRHLRSERVLACEDGSRSKDLPASNGTVFSLMQRAQRRAGLEATGGVHVLRHTFCSHLALAGVPARAIQELAGHADLQTTMRYMHLSPANKSAAVAALGALYSGSVRKEETGT